MNWITNADVEKAPQSCSTCGGCGKVRVPTSQGGMSNNQVCPSCYGSGKK